MRQRRLQERAQLSDGRRRQATGAIVTRFLQDFKKESQQKAKKRKAHGEEEEEGKENQGLNIPAIPAYRVTVQQQTMVFSGQSKKNALHWAQAHFLVKLGMSDVFLSVGNGGEGIPAGSRNPEPAQPFSPFHLEKLEQFACRAETPSEKAHIAAGLVFCILCCLRICQEQDCWITGIKADKFIQGVVFQRQEPKPDETV